MPPILDRHVVGDKVLAVPRLVIFAPVHAGTADHLARQERAEPAHRQRFLGRIIAHGNGVARGVLHQVMAHDIA